MSRAVSIDIDAKIDVQSGPALEVPVVICAVGADETIGIELLLGSFPGFKGSPIGVRIKTTAESYVVLLNAEEAGRIADGLRSAIAQLSQSSVQGNVQ